MSKNPYQSPLTDCSGLSDVEVVFRPRWGWRNHRQVYRFNCQLAPSLLREAVVRFFQHCNARLLQSTDMEFAFERMGTSAFGQFFLWNSERAVPHTIAISLEALQEGSIVTCKYRTRLLIPDFLIPPYTLEAEVRELARELSASRLA